MEFSQVLGYGVIVPHGEFEKHVGYRHPELTVEEVKDQMWDYVEALDPAAPVPTKVRLVGNSISGDLAFAITTQPTSHTLQQVHYESLTLPEGIEKQFREYLYSVWGSNAEPKIVAGTHMD